MEAATDIQLETLNFIHQFNLANGYPPSIQEIASANNVACNAIQGRVNHLVDKGYVTKQAKIARSIIITPEGMEELL